MVFALVLFAACLPSCGAGGGSEWSPRLGLVGIPRFYDTGEAEMRNLLEACKEARVELLSIGYASWPDTEKTPGVFDWSEFQPLLGIVGEYDVRFALDLPTPIALSGEPANIPQDLEFTSYTEPKLIERYKALIRSALQTFGERLDYVTLHAENAEVYFVDHPEQQESFCQLLSAAAVYGRQVSPHVQFGVYSTPRHPDELVRCMNRDMDFIGVAAVAEFPGAKIDEVEQRVQRMSGLAEGRKLALVEVGWPSSAFLGTSEAEQAQVVERILTLLGERAGQIEFASYYTVYDEDRAIAEQWIGGLYPEPDQDKERRALLEWVTSLGLQTIDKKPKPAWDVFKNHPRRGSPRPPRSRQLGEAGT
jgi:hypothetical protein